MICTRQCEWPDGAKKLACPEIKRRVGRNECALMRTREDYHAAFSGRIKTPPKRKRIAQKPGLGDAIGDALKLVGITDERVTQWLGRPCGCPEHRERLNALGRWAMRVLMGRTEKAEEYLDTIIEDDDIGESKAHQRSKARQAKRAKRTEVQVKRNTWSYGVTTVPSRLKDLLPRTLRSLRAAGFPEPRLFVDGAEDAAEYRQFSLPVTTHYPAIRTAGNWTLALWELWIREPNNHFYAIFQDDFITYRNLRQYLEACDYPAKGYLNLYTFPENQKRAPKDRVPCWYESNQLGKGGVAIVFDQDAVVALLHQHHLVQRFQDPQYGYRKIDGGIVTAMKKAGWKEYVHNPSLVQHTGVVSSMSKARHKLATSFRGEGFDALDLLQ